MRNPLTSLSVAAARQIEAAATVPIASRFKLPTTSTPLFRRANAEIQLDTIRSSGTVHSIVHRISSDVARQRFALFLESDRRGAPAGGERRINDHAFLRLWERPNETMTPTSRSFMQLAGAYLELLGEACILVVSMGNQPGGQPFELWPIRPDRLAPVPDPVEWLAGWVYTSEDGERVPLRSDQIVQVKYPDPLDPYRGISPLRSAMTEVDTAEFANELQRNTFENMAMPGGFLTTDAEMSPNDFREWVERWNEQHQGVSNVGRVALMDRGGKFIPQQMSMVDMQLVDLVQSNRGNIREAWGISKTILGQNEDVNRATALAAQQIYGRYTLADRADLWLEACNELVRRFGSAQAGPGRRSRIRVELAEPLTPDDVEIDAKDRDSRSRWALEFIRAGADVNETLAHFGFPVLAWDEERLTAAVRSPERSGLGASEPAAAAVGLPGRAVAELMPPKVWAAAAELTDDQLPDVSDLETSFQERLADLLRVWTDLEDEQKAAIIAAVVALAASGSLTDLARVEIDSSAAAAELEEAMADQGRVGAESAADEAEKQDVELAPVEPDRAELRAVAIVVAALLARRLVSGAVNAAMRANGPSVTPDEIGTVVSDHLAGLSTDGPKPLLSGALTGAQNDGRLATIQSTRIVGDVYASEQNDANTCGPCRRIHGTWLGTTNDIPEIRASYPGGGYGGYVDCEGRERCRGTIVVVWPPQDDD